VYNSYYYTIKCLTSPVHNEISIHIISNYCVSSLQCSVVNRRYSSRTQWGGGSHKSWSMCRVCVCVVDYPKSSIRFVVFFAR